MLVHLNVFPFGELVLSKATQRHTLTKTEGKELKPSVRKKASAAANREF